jgi:hypothetical protein
VSPTVPVPSALLTNKANPQAVRALLVIYVTAEPPSPSPSLSLPPPPTPHPPTPSPRSILSLSLSFTRHILGCMSRSRSRCLVQAVTVQAVGAGLSVRVGAVLSVRVEAVLSVRVGTVLSVRVGAVLSVRVGTILSVRVVVQCRRCMTEPTLLATQTLL